MTTEEILHLNLTDEQYKAVIDDSRNILCLACAGSGKSRTLAYKIAYLISKGEAPLLHLHLLKRRLNLSNAELRRHCESLNYLKII